jgi:hypothetical protein
MVDHLCDEFEIKIITSYRDLGDEFPYSDVIIDPWITIGNAQVYYASPKSQSFNRLASLIRTSPHDVLYLNSFFQPIFTIRPLVAILLGKFTKHPTIIVPKGDLMKVSLEIKRLKKKYYRIFANIIGRYRNLIWQASSEYEANDIRNCMGKLANNIIVVPNLPPKNDDSSGSFQAHIKAPGDPLRICYLGRISKE